MQKKECVILKIKRRQILCPYSLEKCTLIVYLTLVKLLSFYARLSSQSFKIEPWEKVLTPKNK